MERLVSGHLSIRELQDRMLRLRRDIELNDKSGNAVCAWCGGKRSNHLPDNRCSVESSSQYFTNKTNPLAIKAERVLELTEELMSIDDR